MKNPPKKQQQTPEVPPVVPTPETPPAPEAPMHQEPPRRGFFYRAVTAMIGIAIGVVPLLAGLRFFLDPLTRKKAGTQEDFLKITTLNAIKGSDKPQLFRIRMDQEDAWNKFPNAPVGAVFVQYVSDTELRVFNATCPHLGCTVDYRADSPAHQESVFWCPCHKSAFKLTGEKLNETPPRPLDTLEYKIEENGDVKIHFQKFQAGKKDKVEV